MKKSWLAVYSYYRFLRQNCTHEQAISDILGHEVSWDINHACIVAIDTLFGGVS
jgi:hypothetical protein